MKVQEVILRAMAKKITWWQAAEVIGISDRQMRRWKQRYDEYGYDGIYDRRRGKPSPRRAPVETVEKVCGFCNISECVRMRRWCIFDIGLKNGGFLSRLDCGESHYTYDGSWARCGFEMRS